MSNVIDILETQAKKYKEGKDFIERSLQWIRDNDVSLIEDYKSDDAPQGMGGMLFAMGNTSLMGKKKIAIIGSRMPDAYGMGMLEMLMRRISGEYVTVSGFARGIDSAVHRLSIKNKIPTIAVLGCGFAINYPSSNSKLKREIMNDGLMITEYGPFVKPRRYNFISRNMIIAYISDAIVIVQGTSRSGTLNTLNSALKMKKKVYAVPGNINVKLSYAPNYAISRGAEILYDVNELPFTQKHTHNALISEHEREVLGMIEKYSDIDSILRHSVFTNTRLFSILLNLEMKGIIKKTANNKYILMEDTDE